MSYDIKQDRTYQFGVITKDSSPDSPRFARTADTVYGADLTQRGIGTWTDFFMQNPFNIERAGSYHVYEVERRGTLKHVAVGTFARKIPQNNYAHTYPQNGYLAETVPLVDAQGMPLQGRNGTASAFHYPNHAQHNAAINQMAENRFVQFQAQHDAEVARLQNIIDSNQQRIDVFISQINALTQRLSEAEKRAATAESTAAADKARYDALITHNAAMEKKETEYLNELVKARGSGGGLGDSAGLMELLKLAAPYLLPKMMGESQPQQAAPQQGMPQAMPPYPQNGFPNGMVLPNGAMNGMPMNTIPANGSPMPPIVPAASVNM